MSVLLPVCILQPLSWVTKSRGFGLLPPQDVELRRTLASPTGRVREVDESNLPDPNFELAAA